MRPRLRFVAIASVSAWVLLAATCAGSPALAGTDRPSQDNPAAQHGEIGIWKAFVPHGVKGEFDNYDPVGLMAGALIKADCSLNWRDPDNGKLYCFASGTSQVYFQDWPKTNTRKASEAYQRLVHPKPGS